MSAAASALLALLHELEDEENVFDNPVVTPLAEPVSVVGPPVAGSLEAEDEPTPSDIIDTVTERDEAPLE